MWITSSSSPSFEIWRWRRDLKKIVARPGHTAQTIKDELVKVNRDRLSQRIADQLPECFGRSNPKSARPYPRPSSSRTYPRKRSSSHRQQGSPQWSQKRRTSGRKAPPSDVWQIQQASSRAIGSCEGGSPEREKVRVSQLACVGISDLQIKVRVASQTFRKESNY